MDNNSTLRKLLIKILNAPNGASLSEMHTLLVEYGKLKTQSPTVEVSADSIIDILAKQPIDVFEVTRQTLVKKLLNIGLEQMKVDLNVYSLTLKDKLVYV